MQGNIPEFDWTKSFFEADFPYFSVVALCGRRLAYQLRSSSGSSSVELWDIDDEESVVGTLPLPSDDVAMFGSSQSDSLLFTSSGDHDSNVWKFQIWDVNSLQEVASGVHEKGICSGSFVGRSGKIIFCVDDSAVIIWDSSALSPSSFTTLEETSGLGHTADVNEVRASTDGNTALSCSSDTTLKLWDLRTNRLVRTLEGHETPVFCLDMDAMAHVAVSGDENTIRSWDLGSGRCIDEAAAPAAKYVRMHSSGRVFLRLGNNRGNLSTWLTSGLKEGPLASVDLHAGLPFVPDSRSISCSNDLATVATSFGRREPSADGHHDLDQGLVRLWDVTSVTKL